MKRALVSAMALAFCLPSSAALSSISTGNDLLEALADPLAGQAVLLGYLIGLNHAEFVARLTSPPPRLPTARFCMPKGATYGQAMEVLGAWLRNHPATRHEAAIAVVHDALSDAWPCSSQ